MQIESLKVYCDLIETASFSKAAEKNNVTQSAVSQQIRALERRFDVILIERGKKSFSMTPEGSVFHDAAKDILDIYDGIETRFQELQNVVAGNLRIATVLSIGLHELPEYVRSFKKNFGDVDIEVSYKQSGQVYTEVLEGRADLGLVACPQKRKGIVIEEFTKDDLALICTPNHPLASKKRARMSDVDGEDFISFDPDLPTRKTIDREIKAAGITVNRVMEFDNIETVKRAVVVENGVSIVPKTSVAAEVKAKSLVAIDIIAPKIFRPLGIIQKRTRATTPAMREFITLLRKAGK